MKKIKNVIIISCLMMITMLSVNQFFKNNINYIEAESTTQTAESEDSGIAQHSLIGVEVNDYNTFKYYLEINDGNEYHLHLKTNIFVTETVNVKGTKSIIGYAYFIVNDKNTPGDDVNAAIAVNSGATLTIDNCVFDGRNKSSIASSNVVVDGGGKCIVNNNCRFHNGTQGIHVSPSATLTVNNGAFLENSSMGIGSYGTVVFNNGSTGTCGQGLHNNGGSLTLNGGDITGTDSAIINFNNGTAKVTGGNLHGGVRGLYNSKGTATVTGGNFYGNTDGILNDNGQTCTVSGGKIYSNTSGIKNLGNISVSGSTNIYSNSIGINNSGTLTVSNGTINNNTASNGSAIYHSGSSCIVTGGTINASQNVYLAANDKFVTTNTSYPSFVVKPNTYTRGRILVKTSGNTYAENELKNVTLVPSGKWQTRVRDSNIVIWDKSNLTVTYSDEDGNELAPSETSTNWVGENYATTKKDITGYILKATPTNASGTYSENDITVSYIYAKSVGSVEVKYIDQVTKKEIAAKVTITGEVDQNYTTQVKEVEGYELVLTPNNSTGKYINGTITVTYEYRKLSNMTIKYVDLNNNKEIIESTVQTLKEGENYITTAKDIGGYKLVESPNNNNGTVGNTDFEVVYGYKKISKGVDIKYIDKSTGSEIAPTDHIDGLEKDIYTTQTKEIDGYELVKIPENALGEMIEGKIEVVYEYSLIKGKIIISKVDKNDNTKFLSGATFKVEKLNELGEVIEDSIQEKTTDENGIVEFTELTFGKYIITEIKAPVGYELSKDAIEVEINKEQKEINITATDRLKLELPDTGGNGTIVFVVVGFSFIILAIVIRKFKIQEQK